MNLTFLNMKEELKTIANNTSEIATELKLLNEQKKR